MRAEREGPLFTEGMYRDRDARNGIRDLGAALWRATVSITVGPWSSDRLPLSTPVELA